MQKRRFQKILAFQSNPDEKQINKNRKTNNLTQIVDIRFDRRSLLLIQFTDFKKIASEFIKKVSSQGVDSP